ncbi:ABC transporter ATP-binding protein [Boudabousia marimammalium]|uniref:ABC transporter domain-containing protein n=1 Tax=Boudabousia marimammalium TaxID=156892 RepID=A0A1Q5PS66_9ACTO|nr:ABC transporter ATP-binding protein [Boudabousia marimammalium]OKL50428.1 hypothetical protein BM477_00155 [Boudabousia marimammalium]
MSATESPNTAATTWPLLEMQAACRYYGTGITEVKALDNADLTVEAGEFVAVMGPSGSGKSTLLHLAGALDQPTSGNVKIAGTEITGLKTKALAKLRRRAVGYVFQDFNLVPTLTALENVALPLELDGVKAKTAAEQALQILAKIGVAELADRFPDNMSGGQAQRVAIARAIVGPRKLLLADEPTGALDSATGEAVMAVIRQRVDAGAGALVVTHEPRFAAYADRTIFLRDGKIVDTANPDDPAGWLDSARSTLGH